MAALKLLISALIFAAVTALSAKNDSESILHTTRNYRLPDNIVPIHYNIKLIPYIEEGNFTFDGESSITIRICQPTHNVSLHALDLTIDEPATTLVSTNGTSYVPTAYHYDNVTQILVIEFDNDLSSEVYTLSIKFTGILNDDLYGFYRTSYFEELKEVWLAATQFEATWARRAFPCWDEPALKATFNISIKHNRNYTALSNMPVREQTDDDDMIWTHFEKTPIMSTYLIAFVVSDYVRIPTKDSTVNVWCRPALAPYVKLLEEVAAQSGRILTEYTNSTNKIPKMDHVASPEFAAGAMENWGLIIYAERDFTYNEEKDTIKRKQRVALVAAHEMAHQWFGNVVSPSWWSHVWLNEGFASFFQEYLLNELFSEWRRFDYFVVNTLHTYLEYDIEKNMMPITSDVNTPKEIRSLFKWSSYGKGPCILRMLQHIITEDVFRTGIIKYIHVHQFSSATSDDLWSALQEALDKSDVPHDDYKVKEVMDTWTKQRHYPVVYVNRNYENGDITLTQQHFRSQRETGPVDDEKWWIPITFATQSNPDFSKTSPSHWLKPQDQNITIKGVDANDWIIVNLQETGYYRVQYDSINWWKIATYLNSDNYTKIHVLNRAQIIDDFIHLTKIPFKHTVFLELINYLSRETDFIPWEPVLKMLEKYRIVFKLPDSDSIKSRVLQILSTLVKTVGYEEHSTDDDIMKLKRVSILEWACTFGHTECRRMAAIKLNEHLADPETHKVSPRLKNWIFCNGMIEANASTVHKFVKRYANTSTESILDYLACSEKPDTLNNILIYVSQNKSITDLDYNLMVFNIVEKHADNDLVLDYLLTNINKTISRGLTVKKIFTEIINNIYSIERLEKVLNFVKTNFDNEIFEQIKTDIDKRKTKVSDLIAKFRLKDETRELKQSM